MTRQQQIWATQAWLARATGVPVEYITEAHVVAWEELQASIRAYKATEQQARGVRAAARREGVAISGGSGVRIDDTTISNADKWFGERPKLRGEG